MGQTNVRWKLVCPDVVAHTTASLSRRLRGKQSGPWKDTHTGDVCEVVTAAGANASATCTVTSWADIQRWPTHNLNCVISDRGQDAASTFSDNFALTSTTSSAFSGICADIIADNVMCSKLSSKMTGRTLSPSVCVATCDFSKECQLEHMVLPGGPECIFTDILEFASPALTDRLTGEVAPYDFGHILSMCLEPGAVRTCAPCARHRDEHGKPRLCVHKRADSHRAGCPCTDFTSWGRGRKLQGPTVFPLAIWLAMRIILKETMLLIENVVTWPLEIVMSVLRPYYDVSDAICDNESFAAMCVNRTRKHMVLTLRMVVRLSRPLVDMTTEWARKRADSFKWSSLFVATESEVRSEVIWSRSRRPDRASLELLPKVIGRDEIRASLLDSEQIRLEIFLSKHTAHHSVCYLTQDPLYCKACGGAGVLQTIVTNCVLCWSHEFGRWLTCRELAMGQGIPTTDNLLKVAHGMSEADIAQLPLKPLSSFNVSRVRQGVRPRHRGSFAKQVGNTMAVPVVGSVLMWYHMYRLPPLVEIPPQASTTDLLSGAHANVESTLQTFLHCLI